VRQGEAGAPQPAWSTPWPDTQARFVKPDASAGAKLKAASAATNRQVFVIEKSPKSARSCASAHVEETAGSARPARMDGVSSRMWSSALR
jgi:hypothetical protein